MKILKIAGKLLQRDWRSGELRVIALSVLIAVASLTSVGFFTDRAYLAMQLQSSALMGGDLSFSSSRPIDEKIISLADEYGLQSASSVSFPSMLLHGDEALLTSVKAISQQFPLRGAFQLSQQAFSNDYRQTTQAPQPGEIWVELRILQALGLKMGDSLHLGHAKFKLGAIIQQEPGRGGEMFNVAPRLILNQKDLANTGLVNSSSRIAYQFLVAGDRTEIQEFRKAVLKITDQYIRITDGNNARPEITTALGRAEQFLGLAAICSLLIAAVAIIVATRRYTQRHMNSCAIMRCLGATQRDIVFLFVSQMTLLGVVASILGCVIGYIAQFAISELLISLFEIQLPAGSYLPWAIGVFVGVMCILSFSLPSLLQLKDVPTLSVIRREIGKLKSPGWLSYLSGIALLILLIIWQAKEIKIASYMILGTGLLVFCLYMMSRFLLYLIMRLAQRSTSWWRISLINITRRRNSSIIQICSLSVGLMVLILLTGFRQDLLVNWQNSIPPQAPNRFLINIQADQLLPLQEFFLQNGLAEPELYPMIRARLTHINGKKINLDHYDNPRTKHLLRREFNLSWSQDIPSHNEVVAGQWWGSEAQAQISMETGIAQTIGIKLKDVLTFRSGSQQVELQVANFRKVDWSSFKVNFFAIANPGQVDILATTYITSLYLDKQGTDLLNALIKQFPNITVIDVAAIMNHVRGIINKVVLAVQYVFGFALIAGLIVLYSTLINSMDERNYEYALLRTLGANQQKIRYLIISEFAVQGFLASLFAVIASVSILFFIAQYGLKMEFSWPLWPWTYGIGGGSIGLVLLAYLGLRKTVRTPPMPVLLGN